MSSLYLSALKKADEVRQKLGLDIFQPVAVIDACSKLGVSVRLVDINMEGMYISNKEGTHPTILLSNLRPIVRRCFTCAHELGHHVFNHGLKFDALANHMATSSSNDNDERLVDAFAGAFLMPVAGVLSEFAKRNWTPASATPLQFFTISSVFGTGYQTLIVHCRANNIIGNSKATSLLKFSPAKILEGVVGLIDQTSNFKILDSHTESHPVDLEVSNYIILPLSFEVEGSNLKPFRETSVGNSYIATKPGIIQAVSSENGNSFFIRVQRSGYVGLAEYRHLEN